MTPSPHPRFAHLSRFFRPLRCDKCAKRGRQRGGGCSSSRIRPRTLVSEHDRTRPRRRRHPRWRRRSSARTAARSIRAPSRRPSPECGTRARPCSARCGGHRGARVGIASAGPVDLASGNRRARQHRRVARRLPIVDAVGGLFPAATVRLALDGAAAALAEHRRRRPRRPRSARSRGGRRGVGGGLIRGGRIESGRTGNAGHIGHMVVAGGEELCGCGAVGCLETVASGSAAMRWARAHGWTGATGADLAVDAELGEPTAAAALERAGVALGRAFASAAALLDVDLVVVGGGFAQSGPRCGAR
ncbi:ROK family protein [Rhodococcus hoagii]|nr:ROK family protein [Prescottella equi]